MYLNEIFERQSSNMRLLFFKQIFEHINGSLSGLFWRTEKCRTKDLRGGAFSIRQCDWGSKEIPKRALSMVVTLNYIFMTNFTPPTSELNL